MCNEHLAKEFKQDRAVKGRSHDKSSDEETLSISSPLLVVPSTESSVT